MKSLDKKVSSSSYMLWLYLKRWQCIESEFFKKQVDGCLLQEAEKACPKPGAQEEQLCSSQVSCLGQGSMSTWNLHHHLNHTLDIGYLGAFISLSRWPSSSRRWVLNRCSGGCPHMCLRGSLWLEGWALGRKRSQTKGEGSCICSLIQSWKISVEGLLEVTLWLNSDHEGKTDRRDKAAPSLPACGEPKINHSVFWSSEVLYNPLKNIIGTVFSQDSLLGSSDAELNGVTLPWLCEHMRKYFIIYCVVSSVLLQTRQSFQCWVELRGLFQDYCGDNVMISKRLRIKGGQSLGGKTVTHRKWGHDNDYLIHV